MFHRLFSREIGIHRSYVLSQTERARRISSLKLSQHGETEQVHTCGVNTVDIDSIEEKYLLSASSNGKITIHDTEKCFYDRKFKCNAIVSIERTSKDSHKQSVETVQWYPEDTGMFLSSSVDRSLKVWDTNAVQVVENFQFDGMVYHHQMAKNATKHCLVAAANEDSRIYLCDLKSGSKTHVLRGHNKAVVSVSWSPRNEYLLASGSRDSKVLLWDVRKAVGSLVSLDQHNGKGGSRSSGINTAHNGHVNGMSFSSDGLHLLTYGTDDRLRLWDVFTAKNTLVNFGRTHNPCRKSVKLCLSCGISDEVAFVPSGSSIEVYSMVSGKYITSLGGHFNNVNCCIFHSHFQALFSGANDTNILVWLPEMDRLEDNTTQIATSTNNINPYKDSWSSDDET